MQAVRTCQQVFSAAFIGHVEAAYDDVAEKNAICTPLPHPNTDIDFLRTHLLNVTNAARWSRDKDLKKWLQNARLDGFTHADRQDNSRGMLGDLASKVIANLHMLIANAEAAADHP